MKPRVIFRGWQEMPHNTRMALFNLLDPLVEPLKTYPVGSTLSDRTLMTAGGYDVCELASLIIAQDSAALLLSPASPERDSSREAITKTPANEFRPEAGSLYKVGGQQP